MIGQDRKGKAWSGEGKGRREDMPPSWKKKSKLSP